MNKQSKVSKVINMKTVLLLIIVLTALVSVISNRLSSNEIHGNDLESIKKMISTIESYENTSIDILDMKDFGDDRIVGFLSDGTPAYIEFSKNDEGNYSFVYTEMYTNNSFSTFIINFNDSDPVAVVIKNRYNDIAKLELSVNNQVIEQEFNVNQDSLAWIELPHCSNSSCRYDYKYYDINGILIDN